MDHDTGTEHGNIIPFPAEGRCKLPIRRCPGDGDPNARDVDQGPSPDESLRLMRAFVAIKDKTLRTGLIDMIEATSRAREQAPARGKE